MERITKMPEAVHSAVRSGILLYDLARVVEELVFNSLDAGATKVSIALNISSCYVKVWDNGFGVSRDGLALLGEKYASSKHDHVADMGSVKESFGFRGEALGSISDVSLLEIITKTHGMPNGYRKVMKGCKCLYLGISDDREDAGTTVIVRDLFYNQPVRRKHMQSSPKKVLHSVKKCLLRIALVHPKVSFRVIDIESDGELFCTGPSPSPLPMLKSGFGVDVSSSLQELNVSNGILKVSGYISGPSDILSPKAFQYIYVNSRFVSKGPIHKLLNQLAVKFNTVDQWKLNSGSLNLRRSGPQICPKFLLNINCQRSLYDITFEPSRTSVEFKDWGPVLTFVESVVTQCWGDRKSDALLVKCDTRKKRCRTQKQDVSLQLPSSQLRRTTEDCTKLPAWKECLNSFEKSSRDAPDFEDSLTGDEFFYIADNPIESYDCSHANFGGGILEESHSYTEQSPCISIKDTYLEDELFAAERPLKLVKCSLGSKWEDISIEADDNMIDMSEMNGLSADYAAFTDEIYVNQVKRKPFLSSLTGKLLQHAESSFENDEPFHSKMDIFNSNGMWDGKDDGIDVGEQYDMLPNFREKSPIHDRVPYIKSLASCGTQRSKKAYAGSFSEDLLYSSSSASGNVDELYHHLSDFVKPIQESFDSYLYESFRFRDDNHIYEETHESPLKLDKDARYGYITVRQAEVYKFGQQENSTISRFYDHKDYACYEDDFCESQDHLGNNNFPSSSATYDRDWLSSRSRGGEIFTNWSVPMYHMPFIDGEGDTCGWLRIRNQGKQIDLRKRAIRSRSAPPFFRGQKKLYALRNNFKIGPGESDSLVLDDNSVLSETSLKQLQQCSRTSSLNNHLQYSNSCHSSSAKNTADMIIGSRTSPDSPVVQYSRLHGKDDGISFCIKDLFDDCRSRRMDELLDSGPKCREPFQLSASEGVSHYVEHQNGILDLSSGILHLSGDSLVPSAIDKKCLEHARVLQQVDKKFIPIVAGKTLAIIDQHAADERIRLEELRQKVLSGEMKTMTYLETEQELVLPEIGYQLLHNYAEDIQSWGWICNIHARNSKSFTKNLKVLHSQPTVTRLVAVPCILGVSLTDLDLVEYLQQLADTDGSSTIPPAVHRVLNNKACRGAIMFGDTLLPSECSLVVEELKRTSLCFQCAHGRPTTVPLVNLDILHKQITRLGLGSQHESWHGLHRHKISLERAAQRLS